MEKQQNQANNQDQAAKDQNKNNGKDPNKNNGNQSSETRLEAVEGTKVLKASGHFYG